MEEQYVVFSLLFSVYGVLVDIQRNNLWVYKAKKVVKTILFFPIWVKGANVHGVSIQMQAEDTSLNIQYKLEIILLPCWLKKIIIKLKIKNSSYTANKPTRWFSAAVLIEKSRWRKGFRNILKNTISLAVQWLYL